MEKHSKRNGRKWACLIAAAMLSASFGISTALAEDSVIIGTIRYTCQNTCVVSIYPNGFSVRDSGGGWMDTEDLRDTVPPLDP